MIVCDRCKSLKEHIVMTYVFGLTEEGKPCDGQLSFKIDLCEKCRNQFANDFTINKQWHELQKMEGAK